MASSYRSWASHGAAAAAGAVAGGAVAAVALSSSRRSSTTPLDLPLRPVGAVAAEPRTLVLLEKTAIAPPPPPPPASSAGPAAAVTREALGRATWTLLHTLAARFPDRPTRRQRRDAEALIDALTRVYPCGECAAHFAELCARDPPDASTGAALRLWTCRAHNSVNARLGKPQFDCSLAAARWSPEACDGGKDQEEDACAMGVGTTAAAVGAAAVANAVKRRRGAQW
jgi:FAD-linked sulfhydryl oxidase